MAKTDKQRRQALFINPRLKDLCDDNIVNKIELNSDNKGAVWQGNGDGEKSDNKNIINRL